MCQAGPLSGHKVTGLHFRLDSGDHHMVDSSDFSFQCAAEGAMKDVFEQGHWIIIEPVMKVEVGWIWGRGYGQRTDHAEASTSLC